MRASLLPTLPPAAVPSRHPDGTPDRGPGSDLVGLRARVRAIERGAAYGGLRRRAAPGDRGLYKNRSPK